MPECSCPLCPLAEAKLHFCDVRVRLMRSGNLIKGFRLFGDHLERVPDRLKGEIIKIVLWARQKNLKMNQDLDLDQKDCECHVQRVDRSVYKVCFHTKSA